MYTEHLWNLQLFAEDGGAGAEPNPNGQPANPQQQPVTQTTPPTPPTFDEMLKQPGMQAEFDRRVTKAIDTAKSKFADPRVDALQKQLDDYTRREAVMRADVDPKFAKFVTAEVTESLAEGETFDAKLADYLKANPQFVRATEPTRPQAWAQRMQGNDDGKQADGVEAAFKALNPNLKIE